jgi:hypothetical protein
MKVRPKEAGQNAHPRGHPERMVIAADVPPVVSKHSVVQRPPAIALGGILRHVLNLP